MLNHLRINDRIIYRTLECQDIYDGMVCVMEQAEKNSPTREGEERLYAVVNGLLELAGSHGFGGNLWHSYLAYELACHENAFSMACEVKGRVEGSINTFACHDFKIFKELFDYPLEQIDRVFHTDLMKMTADYDGAGGNSKIFNSRIRDRIEALSVQLAGAGSPEEYLDIVTGFYKDCGVGRLGLHKAFRIEGKGAAAQIRPIPNIAHIYLKDLIGYERQKAKLRANTEAFVEGRRANNCLLYGDSGTGKSSSIKALMNEYYDRGLRMIEVYKHQLEELPYIIAQIKDRNYKFILMMDDLSFEDFEVEYKYLKAIIEGGLEKRPDNVLIYATSNRRHLIREKYSDKRELQDDLHVNDTVQEKLSLVSRFGIQIYYGKPDQKEFREIVRQLALRYRIDMSEEQLLAEANIWELNHGGLSGRTAEQFVTHIRSGRKSAEPE